jgi:hypothetical protein
MALFSLTRSKGVCSLYFYDRSQAPPGNNREFDFF